MRSASLTRMDNLWYIVGALIVVAILVAGPSIRRRVNRAAADAGARAGQRFAERSIAKADDQVPAMLDQLGQTVVLDAPEQRAREIVTQAAAKRAKDHPDLGDGTFGLRFAEPTDGIVRLVTDGTATRVQVESFREHGGYPMLMPVWKAFRDEITKAAASVGVTATAGPVQTYTRGASTEGGSATWTRTP